MASPALDLRADCASCFGLCCVALPFARSADFAFSKPAAEPCRNLQEDFRCGIHSSLRESGFKGCTVYDCFGAGQKVAQVTYAGTSWRDAPETAAEMYAVFPIVRQLHEMLWYLREGLERVAAGEVHAQLRDASDRIEDLTRSAPGELLAVDVTAERARIAPLLERVSSTVRATARADAPPLPRAVAPNADLLGTNLRGAVLAGANLRGAYLIGADLTGADLTGADLLGADLRDTRIAGAKLSGALFLTQFQVAAARGDAATTLPAGLEIPATGDSPMARDRRDQF